MFNSSKKILLSSPRGVSLPLVISLIIILMIAATTAYQLIIRSINTADNIEDSSRAYFAAEAGVEDALYELSAHFPGYETPDLDSPEVRTNTIDGGTVRWGNQWEIKNMEPTGDFSGELSSGSKLKLHFFQDSSGIQIDSNKISTATANISQIDVSGGFQLTFSLPYDEPTGYSDFFDSNTLNIDNDGDLGLVAQSGPELIAGLNEDGKADTQDCGDGFNSDDGDCDGSQDEDSPQDPVVTCQAVDDTGRTWQPLDGCLSGVGSVDDPSGGEICEKDFTMGLDKIEATMHQDTPGQDKVDNQLVSLGQFIAPLYQGRPSSSQVSLECLIVAPLVQTRDVGSKKELPFLEYQVTSNAEINKGLPLPNFTIRSDGWYRDFKQSITTTLIPKESVPLLDITIIQQN